MVICIRKMVKKRANALLRIVPRLASTSTAVLPQAVVTGALCCHNVVTFQFVFISIHLSVFQLYSTYILYSGVQQRALTSTLRYSRLFFNVFVKKQLLSNVLWPSGLLTRFEWTSIVIGISFVKIMTSYMTRAFVFLVCVKMLEHDTIFSSYFFSVIF